MAVTLNPYLAFRREARQAMDFYHSVFGGELKLATFADFGAAASSEDAEKIMHGSLVADGMTLMASDTPSGVSWAERGGDSIALSGGGDDAAALRRYWDGLAEGATIREPLARAPWGDTFGMLTDRFGVNWMVSISAVDA